MFAAAAISTCRSACGCLTERMTLGGAVFTCSHEPASAAGKIHDAAFAVLDIQCEPTSRWEKGSRQQAAGRRWRMADGRRRAAVSGMFHQDLKEVVGNW